MILDIPKLSLVVLVGASSSGKSTFARQHFGPTEIVSSDQCRACVSDAPTDRSHDWHLAQVAYLCAPDPALLTMTDHRFVDLTDPVSVAVATDWWERMTRAGGEGMMVKPLAFMHRAANGSGPVLRLIQPAVKCWGREYLRITYGPDYDTPDHLAILKKRGLQVKRSLALREFALGLESLGRFVAREPLRRVHEYTFGVSALESEDVADFVNQNETPLRNTPYELTNHWVRGVRRIGNPVRQDRQNHRRCRHLHHALGVLLHRRK